MAPVSVLSVPQNAVTVRLSSSTAYRNGSGGEVISNRSPTEDESHGRNSRHDRRLSPTAQGDDRRRSGRSNGELATIIRRPEDYQSPPSLAGSPEISRATPLIINCGGYQLSDVLLPSAEWENTRQMLKEQTDPFEDLASVKITIYSNQPGRSFRPRQLRIRSGRGSKAYTLVHVVELLAKNLVKGSDASIDPSHLSQWYLDSIVRETRDTTFRCCFGNCGSSKWEDAQRMGLAQFVARHDTWDRKQLQAHCPDVLY